jgi:hypothetical protein
MSGITYKGHELYADANLNIRIRDIDNQTFKRSEDAQAYVDRIEAAKRVAAKVKITPVPVIVYQKENYSSTGKVSQAIITGVHGTQKRLLIKPKIEGYAPRLYPDVPWIKDAVDQIIALQGQLAKVEAALSHYTICDPGYGFDGTDENQVTKFFNGINKRVAAANKTTLEAELNKKDAK